MEKKPGRNEPCPCGSGKKYKKCCLKKNQEDHIKELEEVQQEQESMMNEPWPEPPEMRKQRLAWEREQNELYEEFSEDMEGQEENTEEEREEEGDMSSAPEYSYPECEQIKSDFPPASEKDEEIIEEWWNAFDSLESCNDKREHIETFLQSHSAIAAPMDLPDAIFQLEGQYHEEGRMDEYIAFLLMVRQNYPTFYVQDYQFYDNSIISYKVIHGQKEEVPQYLDLYQRYVDKDADYLFKLIDFLMVSNCQDIVIPFIRNIYRYVLGSPNILRGEDIGAHLMFSYVIPYLKEDCSDDELSTLREEVQRLDVPVKKDFFDLDYLRKHLSLILNTFNEWNIEDCSTNREISQRYWDICLNFMGFLHHEKNLDWMTAYFYENMVFEYLAYSTPEGKRPKQPFVFTKNQIQKMQDERCSSFMFVSAPRWGGMLNGIYYFAEYLERTHSITTDYREDIQRWCVEIFNEDYPKLIRIEYMAGIFATFPQY